MGRPVFHVFTLDELVAASHAIFVGGWDQPRSRVDETTGAAFHRLHVLETLDVNPFIARSMMSEALYSAPSLPSLFAGARVEVLANRTHMTDRGLRRGPSTSGASFPARRYRTDSEVLEGDPLLFFVLCTDGGLEESADLAVEPLARRAEVDEAIARDRALRDQRREVAIVMRERFAKARSA